MFAQPLVVVDDRREALLVLAFDVRERFAGEDSDPDDEDRR